METIKTHVNIPDDRRLVIDLHIPHTIPTGSTDVVLVFHGQKQKKPRRSRVLGVFKGKIRIADDFDNPLGDEFWLGESNEFST
ncbi:MAG: hypothetical protein U9N82_12925 [Thermodesulfobacteriota bacterium]|nr:hypothetical protein [Thermodesulfobacteriota bacterium]